ncbi:hypothetical protein [Sneathiella aquimaris]|uniref:hypothetical protein n=1 Tax=Sneathiella aquimaris TaxID=2599305 RepID=UPI00146CC33E|nr:hypothetical protein [Sneathiella aquimaris]
MKSNWKQFSKKVLKTGPATFDAPGKQNDPVKTAGANQPTTEDQMLEDQIKHLIDGNEFLVNGKISLINLATIKAKLGDKWEKYSSYIHTFAEKVFQQRLTPQDIYYRVGDDAYVFVFDSLSEEEAIIKCSLIAKEIGEQVIGDEWSTSQYGATVSVTSSEGETLLEEKSMAASIVQSLENAEKFNPSEVLKNISPEYLDNTASRISKTFEAIEQEKKSSNTEGDEGIGYFCDAMNGIGKIESWIYDAEQVSEMQNNSPKWEAFVYDGLQTEEKKTTSVSEKLAELIGETEKLYNVLQDDLLVLFEDEEEIEEETDEGEEDYDPEMVFSYWPVLQPTSKRVAAYAASSKFVLENSLWNIDDLPEDIHPSTTAVFDQLVLRRTIVDLVNCAQKEIINMVIIPVNFSTLNTASYRKAYLEICGTIPKSMHKLIGWQIVNSGVQNWHSQLLTAVSAVKKYGRMVGLEVSCQNPQFTDLKAIGVDVVGFDWKNANLSPDALRKNLENFKKRADTEGLRVFLFGIPTEQIFKTAIEIGIEYMAGEFVDDSVAEPKGVYSYDKHSNIHSLSA